MSIEHYLFCVCSLSTINKLPGCILVCLLWNWVMLWIFLLLLNLQIWNIWLYFSHISWVCLCFFCRQDSSVLYLYYIWLKFNENVQNSVVHIIGTLCLVQLWSFVIFIEYSKVTKQHIGGFIILNDYFNLY